ncbi:MAG: class I SAM-dependent methyltransferase [Candidatus Saccharimonadales bacterium]
MNYELIPTTPRSADLIAEMHGYNDAKDFAASLPEGANVLDVGSGDSTFGKTIAELRPDISWTNFDYSYEDKEALARISEGAPENIEYVAGDATKLSELYEPETFDAVFSYWMMPHLSIDDMKPALDAAKSIFEVVKKGGLISIGPVAGDSHLSYFRSGKAFSVVKDETLDADGFAEMIAGKTKLPRVARFIQKTANEVVTPTLGTSRWSIHDEFIPKVRDPKTRDYVSPFSKRGLAVARDLTVAGARYVSAEYPEKVSAAKRLVLGAGIIATTTVAGSHARKQRRN